MSDKPCIMKIGDYITRQDVEELTDEQWDKFRTYLKECGYTINSTFGNKSAFAPHALCIVLDDDGDLTWRAGFVKTTNRITKKLILGAIRNQCCIMKIDDYISHDTVQQLSDTEWNEFRKYLKSHGYNINDRYGAKLPTFQIYEYSVVKLVIPSNLVWDNDPQKTGTEITLEQIRSVIPHSEKTMEIDEIKNKIRFHESEIDKLNSMIEVRQIDMALDAIAKSLKKPNVSIKIEGDSKFVQELAKRLQINAVKVDVKCSSIVYTPLF